jgi:Putative addiction module component
MLAARSGHRVYWGLAFVGGDKMTLDMMIGSLSRDEKLAAMELIWRDLAADSQSFDSPEWHERIIADRLDNPTPAPALPLAEAKAEIKEAIDARRASG